MKIAVLDDYQNAVEKLHCNALLHAHDVTVFTQTMNEDQLAAALQDFDALVLIRERTEITASLLARLPRLRLISQTGKVSGHIDVQAATDAGVAIAEGVGDPTAPAELTWALIMAAYRKIPQYVAHMKAGRWQAASLDARYNTPGRSLQGDTLGIWSYGKLGKRVAGYGKAFGMDVVVWGREASRAQALADGYRVADSKQSFFAQADIVSLHLRLNAATTGTVTLEDLQAMKSSALLVNTSRAELLAPGALQQALAQGRPGYAALDVFETEPVTEDAWFLSADNVVATPHLGYVEQKGYEIYFRAAFENVASFFAGSPTNVCNPAALAKA
ncbi:D-2-hydroxyacid dehydrogenase family protein [Acidovorax sp. CCYZU-2555]|uniref:D-2-hydroxyacid dehydrogenase family protein n=1 Tax=Acidovorax sp. CCYZU-2555 TaxID=2835042 RepID=UPI001BCFE058|nr:D-2-hydroxyacid dehydrogenase family protein [Acidovorax sp. CCYZU-2555]MBS7780485.1 D-2-hydroxyacid dehydrogenase family protein [Acidovorax sp. CCYZU-2555]